MEKKIDLKSTKKWWFIFLGVFIVTLVCLFSFIKLDESSDASSKKAQNYNDLIVDGKDEEELVAEVTFVSEPYSFAVYEDDDVTLNYYMVFDENGYLYIVRLTDDTYSKIMSSYESNPDEFSYTLKGYLFETEKDLKDLAIDYYNESYEEEIVNYDNFENYFGKTYLDETHTSEDDSIGLLIGLTMLGGVFSIIFFVVCIAYSVTTKKTLKKYSLEELEYEIGKASTISYSKLKLYITDKYIISHKDGLRVVAIDEIVWAYISTLRIQGLIKVNRLMVYKKDLKNDELSETLGKRELLVEILNILKEKNNNVMLGYTKENKEAFKQLKKQNKNVTR